MADHAELVQVLELARVVGQQALRDELQQDVVVALEGGEDVAVGLERGEPVDGQVSGPAARLPALLDHPGGVPGGERLGPGGAGLQLTARPRVVLGAGEDVVQLGADDVLREVQRVRARDQRQQQAGAARSPGAVAPRPRRPRRTAKRRSAYRVAMASAVLETPTPAPPTQTRPCTRVPSMVKKRRWGVVDRALVDALRGDVGEAVEEGLARDAYPVEPDASVVHAVEGPSCGRRPRWRRPGRSRRRTGSARRTRARPRSCRRSPTGRTRQPVRRDGPRCRCSPCAPGRPRW